MKRNKKLSILLPVALLIMGGCTANPTFEEYVEEKEKEERLGNVTLTLSDETATLIVGQTKTLTVTAEGGRAEDVVEWSSSDNDVATVENGVVTAKGAGQANIKVSYSGKEVTCVITVNQDEGGGGGGTQEEDEPTLQIDKTTATIKVGETVKITANANGLDGGTVTWSSSDNDVATVDGGTVTGIGAGTATITAEYGSLSKTCTVTVEEEETDTTNYGTLQEPLTVTEALAVAEAQCKNSGDYTNQVVYCAGEIKEFGDSTSYGYKNVVVKDDENEILIFTINCETEQKDKFAVGSTVVFHGFIKNYEGKLEFASNNNVYVYLDDVTEPYVEPAISSVEVNPDSKEMAVGDEFTLTATVTAVGGASETVTWSSADPEKVSVDPNTGKITALAPTGTPVQVTATSTFDSTKSDSCSVTVVAIDTSSLSLDKDTMTLVEGQKGTITATATGGTGDVSWTTSAAAVATVNNGEVTAVAPGEATITATYGTKTATCVVTVTEKTYSLEEIYNIGKDLGKNEETQKAYSFEGVVVGCQGFSLYVQDGNYGIMIYFSSEQTVQPVKGDKVRIKTTLQKYNGLVESKTVNSVEIIESSTQLPQPLAVNSKTDLAIEKQNTLINLATLTYVKANKSYVKGSTDGLYDVKIGSDEDTTVLSLSKRGNHSELATVLAALKEGDKFTINEAVVGVYNTTQIGAIDSTRAEKKITPVESVTLDQESVDLIKGQFVDLVATVLPADADDKTVTWSVDGDAATVENGHVVAVKTGTATVTATSGNESDSCVINVTNPVQSVTISGSDSCIAGNSVQLSATVAPEDADTLEVTWTSSVESVATVENGLVSAISAGTTVITATCGDKSDTLTFTVTAGVVNVTSVTLSAETNEVVVDGTLTLTATVAPSDATDKSVSWTSSSQLVATVEDGVVTALAEGTTVITVTTTDGNHTDEITITVKPILVSSITLNKTASTLSVGDTEVLTATILPDNAADKTLTWSSDNNAVATVNDNGLVTAVSAGTATITVQANDGSLKSATCVFTIEDLPTISVDEKVVIDYSTLGLSTSYGSSENTNYKWTQLMKGANSTIQGNSSKNSELHNKIAFSKPIKYVALTTGNNTNGASKGELRFGDSEQPTTQGIQFGAGTDYDITAEGNVNLITPNGNYKFFSMAYLNGATYFSSIEIGFVEYKFPSVESITLNETAASISIGENLQLSATVAPAGADKTINWSSSDSSVASVDETGLVTGLAGGEATITATSKDGNVTATCAITVSSSTLNQMVLTFKSNSGDGSEIKNTTTVADVFDSESASQISSLSGYSKAYCGGSGGLKLGTSSAAGTLTINLKNSLKIKKVIVNAKLYNSGKATTIAINDLTAQDLTADFSNYEFDLNKTTSSITVKSSKYCWVSSITIVCE